MQPRQQGHACVQVRDAVTAAGIVDTKENCWGYFITRCRNNLHITLAMSPVGDTLRTRCRNFPGLVRPTVFCTRVVCILPTSCCLLVRLALDLGLARCQPGSLTVLLVVIYMVKSNILLRRCKYSDMRWYGLHR